jgi:hypothetical protein
MRKTLLLAMLVPAALGLLTPKAAAFPPRYFLPPRPAYGYGYNVNAAVAYQNAVRLATYENALRIAALQSRAGPSLYGVPPGPYSLALSRAAAQRGADISWNWEMAMFQRMALNRLTGGGSSDGDGPATSSD